MKCHLSPLQSLLQSDSIHRSITQIEESILAENNTILIYPSEHNHLIRRESKVILKEVMKFVKCGFGFDVILPQKGLVFGQRSSMFVYHNRIFGFSLYFLLPKIKIFSK